MTHHTTAVGPHLPSSVHGGGYHTPHKPELNTHHVGSEHPKSQTCFTDKHAQNLMVEIHKILNEQRPSHIIVTKTPESTCPAPGRGRDGTHHQATSAAQSTLQRYHHGHKDGEHHTHGSHHPNDAEVEDLAICEEQLKMRLTANRRMILEVAGSFSHLDEDSVEFYIDCLLSSLDTNDEAMYRDDHQSDKRLVEASESTSVSDQTAAAFVFSMAVELVTSTDLHEGQVHLLAQDLADVHHPDHHGSLSRSDYEPTHTHHGIYPMPSMFDTKALARYLTKRAAYVLGSAMYFLIARVWWRIVMARLRL